MILNLLGIIACATIAYTVRPRREPETPQQEWNTLDELRHSFKDLHAHTGWRWLKHMERAAEKAQREIADRRRDET